MSTKSRQPALDNAVNKAGQQARPTRFLLAVIGLADE
jgi:hypothetical protein